MNVDNHAADDTLQRMTSQSETVQRFYRWNAPIYDLTRWVILRRRQEAVDALHLRPGAGVLEIGCGTGLNFARLGQKVGDTGRIVGIDLSADMLKRAPRRQRANVDLICADAAQLTLRERFDGVLFSYSLRIMPQWEEAVARAFDHLAPGGNLVVLDFGRRPQRLAPLRALFDRYLRLNFVDTRRDLVGALRRHADEVDQLRPPTACTTLLRCSRLSGSQ